MGSRVCFGGRLRRLVRRLWGIVSGGLEDLLGWSADCVGNDCLDPWFGVSDLS
jgi:hypothetical protein